jgi:glycosyltransferase involved in cell wall biosynthesis
VNILYTSLLSPWDQRHGGGQVGVHELATAMAGRGHDVAVLYSANTPTSATSLPYRAHFLKHHERLYLNPIEFARFVAVSGPRRGVVHANGYEGALLRHVTRVKVSVVVTCKHPDPPSLLDEPARCHVMRRARWARDRVIALLERRALRSADLVTSPSNFGIDSLRRRGYLRENMRVAVVHNGAPSLPSVDAPEENVELVCIARMDRHKGVDVLLRSL